MERVVPGRDEELRSVTGLFGSLAGGAALVRAGDPDVIEPDPDEVLSYRAAFARYRQVAREVVSLRKKP
jgi:hypothetical protein